MEGPPASARRRALFALVALCLACACGGDSGHRHRRLHVYAAASLRDAVSEIARLFERRTGIEPVLNFGGSNFLAMQIRHGGHADVFLSAGAAEVDALEAEGLVLEDTRVDLLANQLVVIVPRGAGPIASPDELASGRVRRLSLANTEGVPAGRYARAWLERIGLWERVAERVLPGIDVRAALAAVESGGAEAGVVYRTDARISDEVEVAYVVPPEAAPRVVYPVVALAGRSRAAEARALLAFLVGPGARAVFERHGFLVLAPG